MRFVSFAMLFVSLVIIFLTFIVMGLYTWNDTPTVWWKTIFSSEKKVETTSKETQSPEKKVDKNTVETEKKEGFWTSLLSWDEFLTISQEPK